MRMLTFVPVLALAVCATAHIAVADPGAPHTRLKCGQPKSQSGVVNVSVNLKKGGEVHQIELEDMYFTSSTTPQEKAEFMVQLVRQALDRYGDYVVATRAPGSDEVKFTAQNGWEIIDIAVMADSTGEPDRLAYDDSAAGTTALCSLSGVSTGTSPTGEAGNVAINVFGRPAQVATAPGMPAQVIEQQLMQQLNMQGVPTRWATPADFTGPFADLPHDAMVLYIQPPAGAAPAAYMEAVSDAGLTLDLASLSAPPSATTDVAAGTPGSGSSPRTRLELAPSVFGSGSVRVSYTAVGSTPPVAVDVHDIRGRVVRRLLEGSASTAGTLYWDGRDDDGREAASGVYFVRLSVAGESVTQRVVRAR